jgi:phage/plasmid-like protein (TIGR03299 family)
VSKETLEHLNTNTLIGFTDKRGKAWHYRESLQGGESNHFPGAVPTETVKERLFGWDALESPVYVEFDGGLSVAPERKAIVRSDNGTVLGIFGDGYEPHPYRDWLVTGVENLLDDGLSIGSAGLLRKGAVAWVSVEVPENFTTPEGVKFRPNLLACTSFDGSLATTYKRVITNVVCDNTMSAALGEAGQQTKVKHSKYSKMRLTEARDALALVLVAADEFTAQVKALCEVDVSDRAWAQFVDAHTPIPEKPGKSRTLAENKRIALKRLWDHDERVSPWRNTAYGVVQAVNTLVHHEGIVRGATRADRNMLNAVTGKWDDLDTDTVATLSRVLDRPLQFA